MHKFLILGIAVVYCWIGAELLQEGKTGLGISFIAYAIANIGLYMETL